MSSKYIVVSGVLFGVMAIAHAVRAFNQLPAVIGSVEIPVWASWLATVVSGSLCVWAFSSKS